MRILFVLFFTSFLSFNWAMANSKRHYKLVGMNGFTQAQSDAVYYKIDAILSELPQNMIQHITHEMPEHLGQYDSKTMVPILIQFSDLGPVFTNPESICAPVNRMHIAEDLKKEFSKAKKKWDSDMIRLGDGVHTVISKSKKSTPYKKKIVLNKNLIPHLLGAKNSQFSCGHGNTHNEAKAALIHGLVRLFDETEHLDKIHKELFKNSQSSNSSHVGYCKTNEEFAGRLRINESITRDINCPDFANSSKLVSETARYRSLSFGWHNDSFMGLWGDRYGQSDMAFWGRALSPYEYAADPETHLAYNFEFFQMDPEFKCRKPLVHKHLSSVFGEPHLAHASDCKVNSKIFLHWTSRVGENGQDINVENGKVDLSPERVADISYYRASVGQAAASLFGHAMFRLHMCAPGQEGPNCRQMRQFDLIINPRANPMELKMDQARGFFGAYPSQFFISRQTEIMDEYGFGELRHLFNFPVGGMSSDKSFKPLSLEEKQDFLYATLQYYWSYIGRYKFVSNNCSDETLDLYKMAIPHPSLADKSILTPKGVSNILTENGLVDTSRVGEFTEPNLFSKIPLLGRLFWNEKHRQKQKAEVEESQEVVDESFLYDTYDSIQFIHKLETGKELESLGAIQKEAKNWFELAEISSSSSSICKTHKKYPEKQARLKQALKHIEDLYGRYRGQYDLAKSEFEQTGSAEAKSQMTEINRHYNRAIQTLYRKRMMDMADLLVDVAYEVVDRSKKSDKICKAEAWDGFSENDQQVLKQALLDYESSSYDTMPHSSMNLYPGGYGIPSEAELKRLKRGKDRDAYLLRVGEQSMVLKTIIDTVGPYVGADWDLYQMLGDVTFNIGVDNCRDKLQVIRGTDQTCGDFGKVYRDAFNAAKD